MHYLRVQGQTTEYSAFRDQALLPIKWLLSSIRILKIFHVCVHCLRLNFSLKRNFVLFQIECAYYTFN